MTNFESDRPDLGSIATSFGGEVRETDGTPFIWIEAISDDARDALEALGLTEVRRLHQMRCVLPLEQAEDWVSRTRSYRPGLDDEKWLRVNNAAFAWHPDQGKQTQADLERQRNEPWFDADGFRILEVGSEMAGFCWTKVHKTTPIMGEIYVIAVDPEFAGQGLGRELTADGLRWLYNVAKTPVGMLYVEADNVAALRLYESLGFTVHHSDAAFELV